MKRIVLLLLLLSSSIPAKAWEIDWKSVLIETSAQLLGVSPQSITGIIAMANLYQRIDDYLEEQARLHEQELQTKIHDLQSEIQNLNKVKKNIEDNTSLCEEAKSVLSTILEAQIEEANTYIDAAKSKKMPLFDKEIKMLSGGLALEEHMLKHFSQCDTCSHSPIKLVLIKNYSADKEGRRQHLACIEAWKQQGFKSQEEMEKERIFEKRLSYISQLSEIAKNLSSMLGIGR